MTKRSSKVRLYGADGKPCNDFNVNIRKWLSKDLIVAEHVPPKEFESLRLLLDEAINAGEDPSSRDNLCHATLSSLTELMNHPEAVLKLEERLSSERINTNGLRTAASQGQVKNTGENFINAIAYVLAIVLSGQDEVLVDKGLPAIVRPLVTLELPFTSTVYGDRKITFTVESDLTIFRRNDPSDAILVNAKTRMKEISHIPPFWKLLFGVIGDTHCQSKWGLNTGTTPLNKMLYTFATADNINKEGTNTQGCDVERDDPRNLIALDAALMDYAFVSKAGIKHVSQTLAYEQGKPREALFHELGCLIDLIRQKFDITKPAAVT